MRDINAMVILSDDYANHCYSPKVNIIVVNSKGDFHVRTVRTYCDFYSWPELVVLVPPQEGLGSLSLGQLHKSPILNIDLRSINPTYHLQLKPD